MCAGVYSMFDQRDFSFWYDKELIEKVEIISIDEYRKETLICNVKECDYLLTEIEALPNKEFGNQFLSIYAGTGMGFKVYYSNGYIEYIMDYTNGLVKPNGGHIEGLFYFDKSEFDELINKYIETPITE